MVPTGKSVLRRGGAAVVVLATAVGLCVSTAAVATPPAPKTKLVRALQGAGLSLASTGALAVDLSTGAPLFAHNETLSLIPASNEKLPVTWAALTRLGPAFRFKTDLLGNGHREGRLWRGDLVLKGYGDPTLSAADLDELAAAVHAGGIRRVSGRIRGDESFFDDVRGAPGWKNGWIGLESPPLSALVVDRAAGWPALSPALLAARALREALARRGITVPGRPGLGQAGSGARVLATVSSDPLSSIAQLANAASDNFVAEMLLKQLGALDGELGTTAGGARAVMATMAAAEIPIVGVNIVDGSGLSSEDRLTAQALVGVIRAGLHDPRIGGAFRRSLAVAGRSGTLENRLRPLAGRLRGKTGTTNLSCTLSGIVHGSVVFAVIENGDPVQYWAARAAQDRFVTTLAALPRPSSS